MQNTLQISDFKSNGPHRLTATHGDRKAHILMRKDETFVMVTPPKESRTADCIQYTQPNFTHHLSDCVDRINQMLTD